MLLPRLQEVIYPLRFRNLNSPSMRISTHVDVYEPSEDAYRLFVAKLDDIRFCVSFQPPYLCPSEGHKHGVSIQSLINLSKTFLRISPARNIEQT